MQLTLKYGQKNPLTTDNVTALSLIGTGKAAMTQNGNWSQLKLDAINPDLNLGYLPMPLGEDAEKNDKLNVGIPVNLVINKDSAVWEYVQQDKVYAAQGSIFPDGVSQKFAGSMQAFFAGKSDVNKMVEDMQASWDSLSK